MTESTANRFSLSKLIWLFEAYLRLWPVQLRLRFSSASWLSDKIEREKSPLIDSPKTECPDGKQKARKRIDFIIEMREAVRLAARCHYGQPACLPRSLVLADMLNSRNHLAVVKVGVKLAGLSTHRQLASHAWVEVDGIMIGEPETVGEDFTLLS